MTSPGLSSELGLFSFLEAVLPRTLELTQRRMEYRLYYCVGIRAIIKKH